MLGKGIMQHRPYKQIYSMDTPKLCTCNYTVSLEVL